jgi:L-threonylcarbamoyladenylate synthase
VDSSRYTAVTVSLLEPIRRAASVILHGGIVAFPTETFYGLAVDALDARALARLYALKDRTEAKVSALLVEDLSMFARLCSDLPRRARELAREYWPGPLTIAAPAREDLPAPLVQDGFVAARMSSHPLAHALVAVTGRPITATSANPAGQPPVQSAAAVAAYFQGRNFHLLDGGETPGGLPSTIVRVRGDEVTVLRQGAIVL